MKKKETMKTKKQYTAPELTVLSFKAEVGFAGSQGGNGNSLTSFFIPILNGSNITSNQETWATDNSTFGTGWEE